ESQGSKSSDKAEICPWESQGSKSGDKAEICPWEVAEPPSNEEKPKQDKVLPMVSKSPSTSQALQKEIGGGTAGMRDRASVCPWESPDTEQPPGKPQTGSPALPKAASGRSQSEEKAEISEICPWESQGSKSGDKAEICPWEVTDPQLEKGTGARKDKHPPREASKALKDS
ncbi:GP179 protein, partial [Regulus satrapa]|nr:GP179 protein [Regulus satrapa]